MNHQKKRPLQLGRSAIIGIRMGAVIIGAIAAVTLAVIGFQTYQLRTGSPGGEITILPAFILLFWCGWTARRDTEARRSSKQKEARGRAANNRIPSGGKS